MVTGDTILTSQACFTPQTKNNISLLRLKKVMIYANFNYYYYIIAGWAESSDMDGCLPVCYDAGWCTRHCYKCNLFLSYQMNTFYHTYFIINYVGSVIKMSRLLFILFVTQTLIADALTSKTFSRYSRLLLYLFHRLQYITS